MKKLLITLLLMVATTAFAGNIETSVDYNNSTPQQQAKFWSDVADSFNQQLGGKMEQVGQYRFCFKFSPLKNGIVYHYVSKDPLLKKAKDGTRVKLGLWLDSLVQMEKNMIQYLCKGHELRFFFMTNATLKYMFYDEDKNFVGAFSVNSRSECSI